MSERPRGGYPSELIAAVDDSAAARPVLGVALALAPCWDADVVALHVGDGTGRSATAAARDAGVDLRTVAGDVVSTLLELAEDPGVVALVVGVRGRPGGRRPAGHVALEVLRGCAKPVVGVPPDVVGGGALRRVLLAVEGDAEGSALLNFLAGWGRRNRLEVIAVHVDEESALPPFTDQPGHEASAFASEFLARHVPEITDDAQLEMRVGIPAEQVLVAANELGADLLALAWSRCLDPGHARFVSHVLEHSPIPVLLVPVC